MDRVGRDALLVVRAQLGDRRSLAELVGHWHDPMWRYVRSMLGAADLADDVTQEVWAAALKSLPGLRQPERFAPWLFTIARRTLVDHLREKYSQQDPPDGEHVDDEVDAVLDRAQVTEGSRRAPGPRTEVLILFYLQGHDAGMTALRSWISHPGRS